MAPDDRSRGAVVQSCRFAVPEVRKTRLREFGIVVERDIGVNLEGMVVRSGPACSITGNGVIAPVVPEIISSRYAEPCLITGHRLTYKFGIRASACVRTERLGERVERTVIDFHAGNIIAVIEAYVTVVLRVAQRSVRDRHRDGDPLLRTGLACNAGLVVAVVGRVILHPQFACTAVEVGHFENEGIHRGRHRLLVNAEIEELGGRDIYALAAGFCLDDRVGFVVRVSVTASGHVQRRRRGIIRQRRSWNSGVHAA